MKRYFTNIAGLVVAIIGLIGGLFWAFESEWEWEPIILFSGSFVHLIANAIALNGLKKSKAEDTNQENRTQIVTNLGSIKKQVNINRNKGDIHM